MDLSEIKEKYRRKAKADIKDLDLILQALPHLVREIERLEGERQEYEERIALLLSQLKKRPPTEQSGKKGKASWSAEVDEEKNRLTLTLAGRYDYGIAKVASNQLQRVFPNLRKEFDAIVNLSDFKHMGEKRILFHLKKLAYHIRQIGPRRIILVFAKDSPALTRLFDQKSAMAAPLVQQARTLEEAVQMLESIGRFLRA